MKPNYSSLEYLYAFFALGMLVLFVASFYFDESRVRARKLRRLGGVEEIRGVAIKANRKRGAA